MTERRPAEVFPPWDFVRDELQARNWEPHMFLMRAGLGPEQAMDLIGGAHPVTPDTATKLATAFGTSAEYWLSLQAAWDARMEVKE